ncbi:MAG: response regulator [Thermodesulfovibrionales bacterium]
MDEHIRILCVDDEQNVLKSLERFFIDDNYEILCAASGEEGLEIMQKVAPVQIVISDYRMPGMNGVEFLKEVCSRWPNTVRIVLSGYADTAAVVSAINEGQIYKFIPKPWDENDLRVAISNSIDRYFLYKKNLQLSGELKRLKDMLDGLPAAVLCIDPDGLIVFINQKGNELFKEESRIIPGTSNRYALPAEIQPGIDEATRNKSEISGAVLINNRKAGFKASSLLFPDERSGIILLFDREDRVA